MITSASYSKLLDFESCKYRAKLKHVDRIPEEKHEAAERGTMIHQLAEDFVSGKIKVLPAELNKFADEFLVLQRRYKDKQVSLEGEWGFDKNWQIAEWKSAWLRMKLDALVHLTKSHGIVIDYKTGKKFGNEIKHGEQIILYAIASFLRHPELTAIDVELWYLDLDDMTTQNYTRNQALRYLQPFEKRLVKMTSATEFPPNPNIFSCKWCPYGPDKGGQCTYGITDGGRNMMKDYRRQYG